MKKILTILFAGFFWTDFAHAELPPEVVEISELQEKFISIECSISLAKDGDSVILKFFNPTDGALSINSNAIKHSRFSAGFRPLSSGDFAGAGGMSGGIQFDHRSFAVIEGEVDKNGLILVAPGKSVEFKLGFQEVATVIQRAITGLVDEGKGTSPQVARRLTSLSFTFKNIFRFPKGDKNEQSSTFTTPSLELPDDFKIGTIDR